MSLWYLESVETGSRYVKEAGGGRYRWVGLRGRPVPDVDYADSSGFDQLVSERLVAVLRGHGFSGWEAEPVDLEMGQGQALRFSVTGVSSRLGRAFHDEHVREVREPAYWVPLQACNDPAPDGWDGSDIFQPDGTYLIVLTDPVHQALVDAGLKVEFVEVGRRSVGLYDPDDLDDDDGHHWRKRMGVQPGERAGDAVCPTLLEKYKS